ncbi:MAG: hypothetical protein M3203_02340 [Actinomycetota bacterium]|nr:hypothetical protein [Actinomycetota bacterium]
MLAETTPGGKPATRQYRSVSVRRGREISALADRSISHGLRIVPLLEGY